MKIVDVADLKIPKDVKWCDWFGESIGIQLIGDGYVTIDFRYRVYRGGLVTYGLTSSDIAEGKSRRGKGWKQKLVDDAVAYLRRICER